MGDSDSAKGKILSASEPAPTEGLLIGLRFDRLHILARFDPKTSLIWRERSDGTTSVGRPDPALEEGIRRALKLEK